MKVAYEIINTRTNEVIAIMFYRSSAEWGVKKLNSVNSGKYIYKTIVVDNDNNKIDVDDWWE